MWGVWYIPDYFPPVGWRVYLWGAEGLGFLHLAAALVSPLSEVSLFGVSFSMAFLTCFLVVLGFTQRMQRTTVFIEVNITNPNMVVTIM